MSAGASIIFKIMDGEASESLKRPNEQKINMLSASFHMLMTIVTLLASEVRWYSPEIEIF